MAQQAMAACSLRPGLMQGEGAAGHGGSVACNLALPCMHCIQRSAPRTTLITGFVNAAVMGRPSPQDAWANLAPMAHACDVNPRSAACANLYLGLPCFDRTIADLFAEAGAARERWVEQAQRPDFRRCLAVLLLP